MEIKVAGKCQCGCGEVVRLPQHVYVNGHNRRGKKNSATWLAQASQRMLFNNPTQSASVRHKIAVALIGKKASRQTCLLRSCTLKNTLALKTIVGSMKGKKHSIETREQMSLSRLNHLEHASNGWSKKGYVMLPRLEQSCFYRSTWEKALLLKLDADKNVASVAVESIRIRYKQGDCFKHYIPDVLVVTKCGEKHLIEVKPKYRIKDSGLKIDAAIKYAEKHNMFFHLMTETELFSEGSVTTTLVEETQLATVAAPMSNDNGRRYSLNSVAIQRGKVKTLTRLVRGPQVTECDHYGIEQIVNAAEGADAATTFGTWSATVGSGQEWLWKKYELLDRLEFGSNNIFAKTLRGHATFIITGNNGARVIKQLEPHFKPAPSLGKVTPTGPMLIGTLDGRKVIQDPFLNTNRIYLGYKGDSILMAGLIYAPYIPLFSTPTLVTSDMNAQKGFLSASGFKIVNDGLYTYGTISGL